MGFELNDRVMGLNVQLQAFMDKHIYPGSMIGTSGVWIKRIFGLHRLGLMNSVSWQKLRSVEFILAT
jgi:hypothetical protein